MTTHNTIVNIKQKYVDIGCSDNNKGFVDNVGQFFASRISTNSYKKKFDEERCLQSKPFMNITTIKRRYMEINEELKQKREYKAKKRKELDAQWKKLEDEERKFRLEFIYFHKFIKENTDKRERSSQKSAEIQEVIYKREMAVEELQEELNEFKNIKNKMEREIRKYIIYEKYLQEVIKTFPSKFTCITDILNRHSALNDIKEYLGQKQLEQITTGLNAQKNMATMVEEQKTKIIGMKMYVLNLQLRLQTAIDKEKSCERMLNTILYHIILGVMNKIKINCSVWNMYKSMATTKNLPTILWRSDIDEQLTYIKRNILEIERINKIIVPNLCMSQSTLYSKK